MKTIIISIFLFITLIGCEHNLTSKSDVSSLLNGQWQLNDETNKNSKKLIFTVKDGNWTVENSWFKDKNPFRVEEYNSKFILTLINNNYETFVDSLGNTKELYSDSKLIMYFNNDTLYLSPLDSIGADNTNKLKLIRKR